MQFATFVRNRVYMFQFNFLQNMGLSKDAKSARAYMDELDMLREKVLSFFSFKCV